MKNILALFALVLIACGQGSSTPDAGSIKRGDFVNSEGFVGGNRLQKCKHDGTLTGDCVTTPLSVIGASGGGSGNFAGITNSGAETDTGFINPTGLTGTLNDWAPTSFATARDVYMTVSGAVTITGIAGGVDGRIVTLVADPANTQTISFSNENAGSVAANRIQVVGASTAILSTGSLQSITLRYNGTAQRWQEYNLDTARFGRSMTSSRARPRSCPSIWRGRPTARAWRSPSSSPTRANTTLM